MYRHCIGILVGLVFVSADSNPVPKNAVPEETKPKEAKPTIATLRAVLGKYFLSKELRTLMREMGALPTFKPLSLIMRDPKDEYDEDDVEFYLIWKELGLELLVGEGIVKAVFLNNHDDIYGHKQYPGELPAGITFVDQPEAVKKKLGKPEECEEFKNVRQIKGKRQDELWYDYPSLGIRIIFWRIEDAPYTIRLVSLQLRKKD